MHADITRADGVKDSRFLSAARFGMTKESASRGRGHRQPREPRKPASLFRPYGVQPHFSRQPSASALGYVIPRLRRWVNADSADTNSSSELHARGHHESQRGERQQVPLHHAVPNEQNRHPCAAPPGLDHFFRSPTPAGVGSIVSLRPKNGRSWSNAVFIPVSTCPKQVRMLGMTKESASQVANRRSA